jgi:dihydrofolate reductase
MMRRLILKMSVSLDGFVGGPNGEIDWLLRSRDDGARSWIEDTLWQAGLHAMGSRTYYDMAGYWPTSGEPLAAPMNDIPKVVFTRQRSLNLNAGRTTTALRDANRALETRAGESVPVHSASSESWAEAEVVNGDLATQMKRLKQQPGKDILAHGGASFAQSLAASGLIDEYRLLVHPVVLGNGLSLFAQLPKPLDLELRATTLFRSGVTAHVYRPA